MTDKTEKPTKTHYRSIFISDVHLGFRQSNIESLLDFFNHTKSENLYILGDFIDFIHLHEHHGWSKECNEILKKLFSKVLKGTNIKICVGNHDAFLGILSGFELGDIQIDKKFIHQNKFCDYLVCHGDEYDLSMRWSFIAKILCFLHSHLYWFPGVKYLRKLTDSLVLRNIDKSAIYKDIKDHHVSGIIYGHTHFPFISETEMNCGDWVENCTTIVEDFDSKFKLIYWKDKNPLSKT